MSIKWDPKFAYSSIDLEISSFCPVSCPFCPRSSLPYSNQFFDLTLFERWAPYFIQLHSRIILSGLGDPLTHPQWSSFIQIYRAYHGTIGISIHASRLTPPIQERLWENPPSFIHVSLPTVQPSIFPVLCPRFSYEKVIEQLHRFLENPPSFVTLVGMVTPWNPDEPQYFSRFAKQYRIHYHLYQFHNRAGHLRLWEGEDNQVVQNSVINPIQDYCGLFTLQSFIGADGKLYPCPHDVSRCYPLLDLSEVLWEDLLEVKYRIVSSNNPNPFPICHQCNDIRRNLPLIDQPYPLDKKKLQRMMRNYFRQNESYIHIKSKQIRD